MGTPTLHFAAKMLEFGARTLGIGAATLEESGGTALRFGDANAAAFSMEGLATDGLMLSYGYFITHPSGGISKMRYSHIDR